ncbi:hypothetical protein M413DRAFT_432577 [Hebeloma cylindrosporum]|uniref:Uncharacterized protein n=1 Tax=Hebeloma cylindrosporum TaxID=76867 RepID=A0A0C3CMF4_HEBCY|nr:hypothetical protein M413DRAFT_432577 [Hebeloma cylindrosporum h7]
MDMAADAVTQLTPVKRPSDAVDPLFLPEKLTTDKRGHSTPFWVRLPCNILFVFCLSAHGHKLQLGRIETRPGLVYEPQMAIVASNKIPGITILMDEDRRLSEGGKRVHGRE